MSDELTQEKMESPRIDPSPPNLEELKKILFQERAVREQAFIKAVRQAVDQLSDQYRCDLLTKPAFTEDGRTIAIFQARARE